MNRKLLFFLCFLYSILSIGQRKYFFDYFIEYDFQSSETENRKKVFLLTNSKDNSYYIRVFEKDSLTYNVYFLDSNGIFSTAYIDKKDFLAAETISLKCNFITHFSNPFKYQVDNYHFENKNDTIIDKESFKYYILKSNNPKREKRKKLAVNHYVVERNTEFHLPILVNFVTALEEYKVDNIIPNGIAKVLYIKSFYKKKLGIYSLNYFVKINKFLIVPKECSNLISIKETKSE
jgi:hypothetical protein